MYKAQIVSSNVAAGAGVLLTWLPVMTDVVAFFGSAVALAGGVLTVYLNYKRAKKEKQDKK